MIQRVGDLLQLVAESDEIDDVVIPVERPKHLDVHPVIVPMQPLAHVAVIRDEVGGREDVVFFSQTDAEVAWHASSIS